MDYIRGTNRHQVMLFPESVEEYITEDNAVRFIDAFVESLDLAQLGFRRAQPAETGRPAYDPGDLLRLYLYGYLNRVRSSRMLERETKVNIKVMWLLGKLRPDFKTIAATTWLPLSRSVASLRSCAGSWDCLAGSWWPLTAASSKP